MDLLGGGMQQQPAAPSNPFGGDIFGGGASGGDMFGDMQSSAPSFPDYTAYEDAVIKIGFKF